MTGPTDKERELFALLKIHDRPDDPFFRARMAKVRALTLEITGVDPGVDPPTRRLLQILGWPHAEISAPYGKVTVFNLPGAKDVLDYLVVQMRQAAFLDRQALTELLLRGQRQPFQVLPESINDPDHHHR